MHCAAIYYRIGLWRHHFKDGALSKQLHQTLVFGEDTDVIHLHSCDLNTQFDFTVPSLQFVRLNVVFGHFIFVSSLVERPSIMLPANRRVSDKSHAVFSESFLFIVRYWESSKESSVFFCGKRKAFHYEIVLRGIQSYTGWVLGLFWNATKTATFWRILRYIFLLSCGQQNYVVTRKFMYL